MTRKSVQGGYCDDNWDCALESTDCRDPSAFRSARQMQGAPLNAHGGRCRWQSAVTSFQLGRCSDGDGLPTECAPNADSCPIFDGSTEGLYTPAVECGVEETRYGKCDYGMCAWGHEHCAADNTWEPFSEGCTCDRVQVGGCSRDTDDGQKEVFCAVSSLACDEEQTWIVPQEVQIAAGFVCYLCREVSSTTQAAPESNLIMDSGTPNWALLGNCAVLALGILCLVGLKYKLRSKRRDAETRRRALVEEHSGPPTRTIHITKEHHHENNNHHFDSENGQNLTDTMDMDNTSVLSDDTEEYVVS